MTIASAWWTWLLEKDVGGLAVTTLVLTLIVAIVKILRDRAAIRKLVAETRKIDADTRAMDRAEREADRERVRNCARAILNSVSALVDELYATFYLFAFPPDKVSKAMLAEAVQAARRFRQEQRYRVEMETLLAELAAYAGSDCDAIIAQLGSQAQQLLIKVSDKKALVARIESGGLDADTAMAVASWLGDVRELQILLGASVGAIAARLSLAQNDKAAAERGTKASGDVAA
ncbi:hypothetical protein [uncultured Bradyrhizobium sp.]|uniref:hypothetical protein n=1 Tax=uncultured Bradyrhizobium sp. TaxID=199684 RepID=UPI0035CBE756